MAIEKDQASTENYGWNVEEGVFNPSEVNNYYVDSIDVTMHNSMGEPIHAHTDVNDQSHLGDLHHLNFEEIKVTVTDDEGNVMHLQKDIHPENTDQESQDQWMPIEESGSWQEYADNGWKIEEGESASGDAHSLNFEEIKVTVTNGGEQQFELDIPVNDDSGMVVNDMAQVNNLDLDEITLTAHNDEGDSITMNAPIKQDGFIDTNFDKPDTLIIDDGNTNEGLGAPSTELDDPAGVIDPVYDGESGDPAAVIDPVYDGESDDPAAVIDPVYTPSELTDQIESLQSDNLSFDALYVEGTLNGESLVYTLPLDGIDISNAQQISDTNFQQVTLTGTGADGHPLEIILDLHPEADEGQWTIATGSWEEGDSISIDSIEVEANFGAENVEISMSTTQGDFEITDPTHLSDFQPTSFSVTGETEDGEVIELFKAPDGGAFADSEGQEGEYVWDSRSELTTESPTYGNVELGQDIPITENFMDMQATDIAAGIEEGTTDLYVKDSKTSEATMNINQDQPVGVDADNSFIKIGDITDDASTTDSFIKIGDLANNAGYIKLGDISAEEAIEILPDECTCVPGSEAGDSVGDSGVYVKAADLVQNDASEYIIFIPDELSAAASVDNAVYVDMAPASQATDIGDNNIINNIPDSDGSNFNIMPLSDAANQGSYVLEDSGWYNITIDDNADGYSTNWGWQDAETNQPMSTENGIISCDTTTTALTSDGMDCPCCSGGSLVMDGSTTMIPLTEIASGQAEGLTHLGGYFMSESDNMTDSSSANMAEMESFSFNGIADIIEQAYNDTEYDESMEHGLDQQPDNQETQDFYQELQSNNMQPEDLGNMDYDVLI